MSTLLSQVDNVYTVEIAPKSDVRCRIRLTGNKEESTRIAAQIQELATGFAYGVTVPYDLRAQFSQYPSHIAEQLREQGLLPTDLGNIPLAPSAVLARYQDYLDGLWLPDAMRGKLLTAAAKFLQKTRHIFAPDSWQPLQEDLNTMVRAKNRRAELDAFLRFWKGVCDDVTPRLSEPTGTAPAGEASCPAYPTR